MLAGCETLHTRSDGEQFAVGVIYVLYAHNFLFFRKRILNSKLRSPMASESIRELKLNQTLWPKSPYVIYLLHEALAGEPCGASFQSWTETVFPSPFLSPTTQEEAISNLSEGSSVSSAHYSKSKHPRLPIP